MRVTIIGPMNILARPQSWGQIQIQSLERDLALLRQGLDHSKLGENILQIFKRQASNRGDSFRQDIFLRNLLVQIRIVSFEVLALGDQSLSIFSLFTLDNRQGTGKIFLNNVRIGFNRHKWIFVIELPTEFIIFNKQKRKIFFFIDRMGNRHLDLSALANWDSEPYNCLIFFLARFFGVPRRDSDVFFYWRRLALVV